MKDTDAEKIAETALQDMGYVTHRVKHSAIKTPKGWVRNGQDIWGVIDVAAYEPWMIRLVQVTTKNGVSYRRRKIERTLPPPVSPGILVQIWEARTKPHPTDGRKKLKYFRVHDYRTEGWVVLDSIFPERD